MNNQMDKAKFLEWLDGEDAAVLWEGPEGLMKYDMLVETINSGEFDPDTPPVPTIKPGDKVRHSDLGEGTAVGYGEQVIEISTIRGNFDGICQGFGGSGMKKVRITGSSPVGTEYPIHQLIGQEFEVKDSDKNGYYIGYGETGLYFIHSRECEEVVE